MAFSSTIEVARSINSLIALSSEIQEALIEVIGDYFCSPSTQDLGDDSDNDDDDIETETGNVKNSFNTKK